MIQKFFRSFESRQNSKAVWSWIFYDWANSAFYTTVVAGFFPIFFKLYWSEGHDPLVTTSRLGFALSLTSALLAVVSPLAGAWTDLKKNKKKFLMASVVVGAALLAGLAQVDKGQWFSALLLYCACLFLVTFSCLMYDGLLIKVSQLKDLDRISSVGYSMGYLGGGLLFTLNVLMYLKPELFGIADGVTAVKYSFLTVSVWWLLFSLPLFFNLREKPKPLNKNQSEPLERFSFIDLIMKNVATFLEILKDKNILFALLASWLILDGVNTVITMAVDYGVTLGFGSEHLIAALLITQFVGFPFAYFFGFLAAKKGCKKIIIFAAIIYIVGIFLATQMQHHTHFYLLAALIGSVQGCVQSLSRSLFAKLIPEEKNGEYFAFYNLIGKYASIIGPFLISVSALTFQSSRYSLLSVAALFILGAVLLSRVKEPVI